MLQNKNFLELMKINPSYFDERIFDILNVIESVRGMLDNHKKTDRKIIKLIEQSSNIEALKLFSQTYPDNNLSEKINCILDNDGNSVSKHTVENNLSKNTSNKEMIFNFETVNIRQKLLETLEEITKCTQSLIENLNHLTDEVIHYYHHKYKSLRKILKQTLEFSNNKDCSCCQFFEQSQLQFEKIYMKEIDIKSIELACHETLKLLIQLSHEIQNIRYVLKKKIT